MAASVVAGGSDQFSYPNLLRSCAWVLSGLAVEDPLINLIIRVLILGWKYSTRDHIFNWQWSQGSPWSGSASDNWLNFGIKASLQTRATFLLKSQKYLNTDKRKGFFPSHNLKIFSNMKRQRSWMRVECNVEIISQLEVGGGGTDWLVGEPSLLFLPLSTISLPPWPGT